MNFTKILSTMRYSNINISFMVNDIKVYIYICVLLLIKLINDNNNSDKLMLTYVIYF